MARVEVEITHPDKVLFLADGITKADLIDYYSKVSTGDGAALEGTAVDPTAVPPRHRRARLHPAKLR